MNKSTLTEGRFDYKDIFVLKHFHEILSLIRQFESNYRLLEMKTSKKALGNGDWKYEFHFEQSSSSELVLEIFISQSHDICFDKCVIRSGDLKEYTVHQKGLNEPYVLIDENNCVVGCKKPSAIINLRGF